MSSCSEGSSSAKRMEREFGGVVDLVIMDLSCGLRGERGWIFERFKKDFEA